MVTIKLRGKSTKPFHSKFYYWNDKVKIKDEFDLLMFVQNLGYILEDIEVHKGGILTSDSKLKEFDHCCEVVFYKGRRFYLKEKKDHFHGVIDNKYFCNYRNREVVIGSDTWINEYFIRSNAKDLLIGYMRGVLVKDETYNKLTETFLNIVLI
jgi:hypothetical protein